MKRIIITVLAIAFYLSGVSQDYVPFPTSNVNWNEIKLHQGYCDPPEYCRYTYFIEGDTLLNSTLYNKIYSNDSSWITYVGGIREEDKRIYYHDQYCSESFLLYDFNFQVGDSIGMPIHLCGSTPYFMTVASIDSVLLEDMTYRKRFNFEGYPSWIEGIGSEDGLLYPYFTGIACVCFVELVCFEHNNTTIYFNETNVPCFDFIVSNKEAVQENNNFQLYPNPANNEITISGLKDLRNTEVNIYTQTGQKVLIIKSPVKTIDISNLKPGLYFAEIKTSEGDVMKKIVVQ